MVGWCSAAIRGTNKIQLRQDRDAILEYDSFLISLQKTLHSSIFSASTHSQELNFHVLNMGLIITGTGGVRARRVFRSAELQMMVKWKEANYDLAHARTHTDTNTPGLSRGETITASCRDTGGRDAAAGSHKAWENWGN